MVRLIKTALILVLVLALGGKPASAASYRTIQTHSGFGSLFVLASDAHGDLYVADQNHFVILKLSPSGHVLLKDPMPKKCGISGLAASALGDVYAVANCQSLVYHFSPSGHRRTSFGRQPPGPNGVALDSRGRVYVTYGNPRGGPALPPGLPSGGRGFIFDDRLVVYTAKGSVLRTVKTSKLHQPWGIAIDRTGNAYVTGEEGMVKISPAGTVLKRWSTIVPPQSKNALPGQPAVDAQGNVYATDRPGNILKISASGRLIGAVVRQGTGPNAVRLPQGLTVVGSHLFVADAGPNRIKEFSLSGRLLAIWAP